MRQSSTKHAGRITAIHAPRPFTIQTTNRFRLVTSKNLPLGLRRPHKITNELCSGYFVLDLLLSNAIGAIELLGVWVMVHKSVVVRNDAMKRRVHVDSCVLVGEHSRPKGICRGCFNDLNRGKDREGGGVDEKGWLDIYASL